MFRKLLLLQWKSARRSAMWQKNLAINLIIGFFLVLSAFYVVLLGLLLDQILHDIDPNADPAALLNGVLLYAFLAGLLIRFIMQSLPRLVIESYLHLPLTKRQMIHFMMLRSVPDIFNLMPLLFYIPATFSTIAPALGMAAALRWLVIVLCLVTANNFLGTWLKRLFGVKPSFVGLIVLVFAGFVVLDRTGVISLFHYSERLFRLLISHTAYLALPLAYAILAYLLHYRFLRAHIYTEENRAWKQEEYESRAPGRYFRSLGLTGSILALESRLYWRNKRTKTIIYMAPLFLLYGLIFYTDKEYESQEGFLIFVGFFMTGGMMMNYANYAFGYESGYFDALLTKSVNMRQYIRVKYIMACLITTACYVLTIPYVYFGVKVLMINTAIYLFNMGIQAFVLLYMATYNKKRMDLSRGSTFNYQGIGAVNYLAILPAFLLPLLLYLPFGTAGYGKLGLAFIALCGIAGLLFSGSLLNVVTHNFYYRKYVMAAGFRQRT